MCAAHELESLSGVVTVTDATGRILAEWGDAATVARAADANLAPWYCWSECAAGTNGMGTALEAHGPVLVSGPEHWCAGVPRLGLRRRRGTGRRDEGADRGTERVLLAHPAPRVGGRLAGECGHRDALHVETARPRQRRRAGRRVHPGQGRIPATALAAVDTAGKVVIADETGERADGRACLHPGASIPRSAGTPACRI